MGARYQVYQEFSILVANNKRTKLEFLKICQWDANKTFLSFNKITIPQKRGFHETFKFNL